MQQSGAERAWIMTSPLMQRAADQLLTRWAPNLRDLVRLIVTGNEFLGGNIMVMDMCTVSDVARAVERELQSASKPDLLLLSDSGFNRRGRDLEGRHWRDLERWLGIPVRLLSVSRFSY